MAEKFETVEWAATANIYEINLRQYSTEGTFAAFERSLPRLHNMGIKILWFMPITPISIEKRQGSLGSYYACSDYKAINTEFGTITDFKKIVQSAHELGFKLIIDWVANHTGYDHVWTKAHPEFYKKNEQGNFYEEHGWVDVIDLDYNNKDLWNAMIEAMNFWVIECGIDGFRCDMAHLVPLDFWQQARTILDQHKQKLFWLAECEDSAYYEVFDATYGWELLHKMEAVYRREANLQDLKNVLEKYAHGLPEGAFRLLFTSNHDENSHSGSEFERMGDGAKAFAVLCATWKNSLPLIYSGQEMPNKKRIQFFDKDEIRWTGEYYYNDFYRTLLTLRKNCSAIQSGEVRFVTVISDTNAGENVLIYVQENNESEVLVVLNMSPQNNLRFSMDKEISGSYRNAFTGTNKAINETVIFDMQAWEYLIYIKNSE